MKQCSKFEETKTLDSYWKCSKSKDGLQRTCIECYNKRPSRTKGTLSFFKRQSWSDINRRTVNGSCAQRNHYKNEAYFRKGIRIEMTKQEFYDFCDVHKDIIMKLYQDGKTPSIDRIDPNKNYEIENIQIMSLAKNIQKAHKGRGK